MPSGRARSSEGPNGSDRVSAPPRGPLPPEQWFPAGSAALTQRYIVLESGLRVRVVEGGPSGAPVAVFVHGWGCSAYSFHRNLPAIAEGGYRVVGFDLAGHGLSDKPTDADHYTFEAMCRHVVHVLDALGIARAAVLAGHSLGGALAAGVAARFPARIARLALFAPVGFGPIRVVPVARVLTPRVVAPLLAALYRRTVVAITLRLAYGRGSRPTSDDIDQYWAPARFRATTTCLWHLLHAFDWRVRLPDELAGIGVPTLVMVGGHDRLIQWRNLAGLVRALPDARLRFVPGAGHVIPEERPAEVNAALLELLSEPAGRA